MYLCGLEVHFAEICSSSKIETNDYGLLLDAFLSLLEMHLEIVCVQAIGLCENAFGMFLCSMAFFCLCMRKFQKRI